jgi:hypothetical protein
MNKTQVAETQTPPLTRFLEHVEMIAARLIALEGIASVTRLQSIEDRLAALEATREGAARE